VLGDRLGEKLGGLMVVDDGTRLGEALVVKLGLAVGEWLVGVLVSVNPPSPPSQPQANLFLYWHCRPTSGLPQLVGGAASSRFVSNLESYT
jgi:hypothetical protein